MNDVITISAVILGAIGVGYIFASPFMCKLSWLGVGVVTVAVVLQVANTSGVFN